MEGAISVVDDVCGRGPYGRVGFCRCATRMAGCIALALTLAALGAAAENPVLRVMPLGDSITHGSQSVRGNGYRAPLYVALTNLGYNVDYVGTQTDNYSLEDPFLADSDHEGQPSARDSL